MPYGLLADLLLVLHLAFVLFVALGGLLVLRRPSAAWLHLPAALWGAGIEFTGGICPLTPLEKHWRQLGGGAGYEGGFIEHYVTATLYPHGLTRGIQLALGALVVGANVVIYLVAWRRLRASHRAQAS